MHGNCNGIILILRPQGGPVTAAAASRLSESSQDAEGNTSVVLNRRGNDLHLYRILLTDHIGYQLNNAE
jgi:hypothetical protein